MLVHVQTSWTQRHILNKKKKERKKATEHKRVHQKYTDTEYTIPKWYQMLITGHRGAGGQGRGVGVDDVWC